MKPQVLMITVLLLLGCGAPEAGPDGSALDSQGGTDLTLDGSPAPDDGGYFADLVAPADLAALDSATELTPPCQEGDPCDDQDPCTLDSCQAGVCTHALLPPGFCCQTLADCDDGIPCTLDSCSKNRCQHIREDSTCCVHDGDCNDYQPCTLDLCVANTCAHSFASSQDCQCNGNLDCDDGLPCTRQECRDGVCLYSLAANPGPQCCQDPQACDDANDATLDSCVAFTCQHQLPAPCLLDEHCDDANPCSSDACLEGLCLHAPVPGCCQVAGQCDDASPLTFDSCVANRCVHSPTKTPASCKDDSKCPPDSPCTDHACVSGLCSVTLLPGDDCCAAHSDCQSQDPCLDPICQDFVCATAPHQGPAPVQTWGFDDGTLQGFTVATGDQNASWQPSTWFAYSPEWSLHMGNPQEDKKKMISGPLLKAVVRSPSFTAPDGASVSMWLLVDVEPISSRDLFSVELDCGSGFRKLFNKNDLGGGTGGQWVQRSANLAQHEYGRPCTLRWTFDSVDGVNNSYPGVFLDDISVNRGCPAPSL